MSRRIAEALLKFSEAAAELAYAFGDENTPQDGVASPPAPIRAATPIDAELEAARPVARPPFPKPKPLAGEYAFTKCPAHQVEFKESTFPDSPPYCPMESDDPDPNWTNAKGRCRVTARNAGAWLKQHPKAAA